MTKRIHKRWLTLLLVGILLVSSFGGVLAEAAEATAGPRQLVLTLAADITSDQRANILKYFGITEEECKVITITNADERAQLGGLIDDSVIGTVTLSCALIRLTTSGGIQVKTANMNYVTSNMIASTLSTSGVYNCEVLTAAPYEVSGTGALTGVMMAYEAGTGEALDPELKSLANEELVITTDIAETVGQDQATLIVNDIKIHIVRDGVTDQAGVNQVVDEVIQTTESAAAEAAAAQGAPAPSPLGAVETEQLYDFGYQFSQVGYNYADLQPTLERVTRNVAKNTGIQDPIMDTFTTTDEDEALSIDSILLNTEDAVMGEDANINATNTVAIGEHPADTIEVFTGDVHLTDGGKIKADSFISGTNLIAFRDVNGQYALMDLNGNILTESIYSSYFRGYSGMVEASLAGDNSYSGILSSDGRVVVPFSYDVVEVFGKLWGAGAHLTTGGTEDNYDYYGSGNYYLIDSIDIYYFGNESSAPVATLSRDQFQSAYAPGDYLNIRDRSDAVTTYDSSFQAVDYPDSLYDSSYNEEYRAAEILSDQMDAYVNRFHGNYATIYQNSKYGIVDRYGNIIIPIEFDGFETSYADDALISGGYASAKIGDSLCYVTPGGTITGNYDISYIDAYNYGMSAYVKDDDGTYTLYSADGVVTDLGSTYSYLYSLASSKGLLWEADASDGYDLLDWHGNVLLSGASNYSVSANGNYVIAQDGYSSSTIYLVNDAAPVSIADSSGGALELTAEIREGASLDVFTGDPTITALGETTATRFLDGTSLMLEQDDSTGYWRIIDTNGLPISDFSYTDFGYNAGWLVVACDDSYGLLSMKGAQVLPCEYDYVKVLNENWAYALYVSPTANENDYDIRLYDSNYDAHYCYIDQMILCHLTPTSVSSVTLGRDQVQDIYAEEDYINIQDRTSGAVTTYDSSFSPVAAPTSVYSFKGFSATQELIQQIEDSTGYYLYDEDFIDGYSRVSDYDAGLEGVVDMSGNIVIPVAYDDIIQNYYRYDTHFWAEGYFCVEQNDMFGFVSQGGNVTFEPQFPASSFTLFGASGKLKYADDTYSLIAADGTKTDGYDYLTTLGGNGLLVMTDSARGRGYDVIDWHGNLVIEDISDASMSDDGRFLLVQESSRHPYMLYGVNGAVPEGGFVGPGAVTAETPAEQTAAPEQNTGTSGFGGLTIPGQSSSGSEQSTAPEQNAGTSGFGGLTIPGQSSSGSEQSTAPEQNTGTSGFGGLTIPGQSAPAGDAQEETSASALLTGAKDTLAAGLTEENISSVTTALTQAQTLLTEEGSSAAALVGSALTLMSADPVDSAAVSTLIDTALAALGG